MTHQAKTSAPVAVCRAFECETKSIDLDARTVDVVMSTPTIDRYGERVELDWDTRNFEKNPCVLWAHSSRDLPLGRAENVRVEGKALRGTIRFASAAANPLAENCFQLFKEGVLNGVSVGFISHSQRWDKEDDRDVRVLEKNELVELSVTPTPANPEALAKMMERSFANRTTSTASPTEPGTVLFNGLPPDPETDMLNAKTILALLALPESASEADAVEKVKTLEKSAADAIARAQAAESREKAASAQVSELLAETGAETVEKAKGAIAAGKAAVAELAAEKAKSEQFERAKLISDAKAAKKLTPAQEKGLEGKSLEFVKGFLELQHPNPALAAEEVVQPAEGSSALTHNGKSWGDLSPSEKHSLYQSNKALYEAMRDAASK